MTMNRTDSASAAERARLVSDVKAAGAVLSQAWPIETFIAVNPLGGFEHLPFGEAVRKAGEVLGARGTLGEEVFRRFHAEGRITDADLEAALARRLPRAVASSSVEIGGRILEATEILIGDLLAGPDVPPPARSERMISERIRPAIATAVDEQTSKWCGAFLDSGQAGWQMPGREAGFYTAWRDLAPRDRQLPSMVRKALEAVRPAPRKARLPACPPDPDAGLGGARPLAG
jgi:hypothetical protein